MEYFHLTTPQQNIWNLQRYFENTSIANLCGAIFFQKKRDSELLRKAICCFIQNQSALRLRFCAGEEPMQYVSDEECGEIPVMSFSSREDFDYYAEQFAKEPIGLTTGRMYRFVVFQLENESGILVTLSHLVSDAWTFGLMANQVNAAYLRLADGEDIPLEEGDYIEWINSESRYLVSERYQKDKVYWEEKYAVCPEENPIRLCTGSSDAIEAKRIIRRLPNSLEQKIDTYCREHPVTKAVLFETALVTYLSRVNPENRTVTIGVPVLNRSNGREKKIAGMFVSTMPLTAVLTGDMEISDLERQITKGHMDIFRHQKYPYGNILRMLREKQNFSGNLYDVMVSYQNARTDAEAETRWYSNGYSEVPFVLHIDNRDGKDCHILNVDYQTAAFGDGAEVELIIDRLEYVLGQIVEGGVKKVRDINIVPANEWEKVVHEFNDTYVEYPGEKCVHELFTEQANRMPERMALVFRNETFTYRQLDEMSNSLAHFLRAKGVKPNDIVPIIAKRSWHVIVAMLGVLKAGGAYMPVNPELPEYRIAHMAEIAGSRIVLTYGYGERLGAETIELDGFDFGFNCTGIRNVNVSEDFAYVIFTSGSTGEPKGVTVCHRNISNYAKDNNHNKVCHKIIQGQYESIVSVTNIVFDIFVTESLMPLLNGLVVYFADDEEAASQGGLSRLFEGKRIDVLQTTPTKMRSFILDKGNAGYLSKLKAIILGGEELPEGLYHEMKHYTDARVYNIYGPAETTVWSANAEVTDGDITIGRPIANTQIYILDKNSRPVPIGVPGELCIAGEGVGKGYLNRPELTAERFVPNPFATEANRHGKVMYHTGDLARWRGDGEIEYLGRIDTQVKIRGLRIELGEIESIMGSMEGIGLVAAADKRDETGRQYLVGYYTADMEIDERELRGLLSAKLPQYMVPNFFLRLDAMPMTPSGKIDRKSLPSPGPAARPTEYAPPETDAERRLAEIWQRLLQVSEVGRTDDFFELGGDSLLAISLLNEIEKEFQAEVSVREIMGSPMLCQLAQCVEQAGTAGRIQARHRKRYVLLPQQKAIYAACQKEPGTLAYNMPARLALPEAVDRDRLRQAIARAVDCHRLLKSHVQPEGDEIYGTYEEDAPVVFEEYTGGEEAGFVRPFDLEKGPLVRIGFTEDALLFDMHHIVADGDSVNIILRDIAAAYGGRTLREPEIGYPDYADYFYQMDVSEHKAYFKEMLRCDFEPVALPETDFPGKGGRSRAYRMPEAALSMARKYAKENGMTDTMVLLGAYGILLSRYTGKADVLSSIILQNRAHAGTRDVVGMFVNTLPVHLGMKESVAEYMGEVKRLVLDLFRYQELPFWEIADAVGMDDKTVVNTSFVYQGGGEKRLELEGQELVPEPLDTHAAKFDFSMELTPTEDGCMMRLEYDSAKHDERLMDGLAAVYVRILEQLEEERLADISVLSEEELRIVLEGFNDTYVEYPREKCVHELFTEQAKRTPERTALVFEDRRFTYRQLDEMSNSLAHFLREKGVGPNDIVPIIAKRSWHVIVAMLGVLKAGGAYMPVNPDFPVDRIASMLGTAGSRIALLYGYGERLDAETIELDGFDFGYNRTGIRNVNASEDFAYIIFTSGSTGEPKGVTVCHRNISNYAEDNNHNNVCHKIIQGQYESIVSVTNIVFDIFVTESLLPLLNGLTVCFADDEEAASQGGLSRLFERNGIDVLQTTPTKMKSFILDKGNTGYLRQLKAIILGGEEFQESLYHELKCYTDARVYNIYGPAETTVWSTNAEVTDGDITIGRPIANTQIYILDKDSRPVPIGVPGELCIAGEGVGKGYLNRPELTAERFVPNPFATEANRHGKVMYHTGDLARWRGDGEIEYLGRIDTQVKIRGLRIELGEIESTMGSMEGIGLAAAADKRDETGRQYLVGYYTADAEIDERKLRGLLSAKLPKYMVPNFFLRLDAMPMTPSGKIDRKNLPIPDSIGQTAEYIAPVSEKEQKLCHLLEDMLHMERIGLGDDFFELGGDSLTAIEYVAKAHSIGIAFSLQNVFDYPTVGQLCGFLEKGEQEKVSYEASDFDKYQSILAENVIDETFVPQKKPLGNVLLTGATGFLGAHVLHQLMKEERGKVYCLVRSGKEADCGERLKEMLRYYFGNRYDGEFAAQASARILPIAGDIGQESLAEHMPEDIQTVIHTAATVKHYGTYDDFRHVNVEGTQHVVRFAKAAGARLIHVSTLSVSGNSMVDDFTVYRSEEEKHFYETSLYIGQPLDNVYIRSKFEAERAVYDGMLDGLDAVVVRVGNLTSRASDYKFQPNYRQNAFLTRVKAVLEFGLFPDYLMPLYAEFSPVDLTAEGIVRIAQYADRQSVFHLNSNRPIYFDRFLEVVRGLGIPMEVVDGGAFHDALRRTLQDSGREYIFEAFQNDMDEQGRLIYDSNIRIRNEFTVWFLEKTGFAWNEIDMEYIGGYLEYFRKLGYLEVPCIRDRM